MCGPWFIQITTQFLLVQGVNVAWPKIRRRGYILTSIMSPLFIEHLDIVTQNFKTIFSNVKLPHYYSQMWVSTELLTPLWSSTIAFSTPPVISIKTEPDLDNVVDLFDSSTEDVPVKNAVVHDSPPLFPSDSYITPFPSCYMVFFSFGTVYVQTSSNYCSMSSWSWFYTR